MANDNGAKPVLSERFNRFENYVLALGLVVLVVVLFLEDVEKIYGYPITLWGASAALRGSATDPAIPEIAQDLVGMRGLVRGSGAYPILATGYKELGIEWDVRNATTHPPTAFLFVAPLAFLPTRLALAGWAWVMLVLIASTLVCYGASFKMAIGLAPLTLLWPPMTFSLLQLTIIWMWGIAIAYRFGGERVFWGGIGIGLASLTKFLPALMLVALLRKKQWAGLIGFAAVWVVAGLVLIGLDGGAILEYLNVNRANSYDQFMRTDNHAFLATAYRWGGVPAAVAVVLVTLAIMWALHNRSRTSARTALHRWMSLSFLTVGLLPLVWLYSLAPLFPVILYLLTRGKLSTIFAGICGLLIPGVITPSATLLTMGVIGSGLVLDALPFRLFTAGTLKEIVSPAGRQG